MNTRAWLLVMLAVPVLASAQSPAPAASGSEAAAANVAASSTTNYPATGSLSISNPDVRRVLRAAAIAAQPETAESPSTPESAPPREGLEDLRFRAPRRVARMECDASDYCTAFDADGKSLYSVSRDSGGYRYNSWANNSYDSWLSCQSTNNLLTTFERFDRCRGITVGVSAADKNLVLALPRIERK